MEDFKHLRRHCATPGGMARRKKTSFQDLGQSGMCVQGSFSAAFCTVSQFVCLLQMPFLTHNERPKWNLDFLKFVTYEKRLTCALEHVRLNAYHNLVQRHAPGLLRTASKIAGLEVVHPLIRPKKPWGSMLGENQCKWLQQALEIIEAFEVFKALVFLASNGVRGIRRSVSCVWKRKGPSLNATKVLVCTS